MKIICPNLKNKEVQQQFNELVSAVGETAAYHIWSQNDGNAIDRAPNGAPSKLFIDLLEHFNGDRVLAIQAKSKVFSKSFKEWFGDWASITNKRVNPYDKSIEITDVQPDYDSADVNGPGAMFNIVRSVGNNNYDPIGSISIEGTYKGKNQFEVSSDKYVDMPSVGDNVSINEEFRNKGYGKAAYYAFGKKIADTGKIFRSAPDKSRTESATRVWKSLERDGYAKRLEDRYEFVSNKVSKVVDENGEPLVVWHGSSVNYITEFNENSFFTENKEMATVYGLKFLYPGQAPSVYPVFLSIKNPNVYDAEGRPYKNINGGNFLTFDDFLNQHPEYEKEDWYWRYQTYSEPEEYNIPEEVLKEYTELSTSKTARTYAHDILGKENDGVIITNLIDPASGKETGDVMNDYIPLHKNQIKSAVGNTGKFSTEKPNIYESRNTLASPTLAATVDTLKQLADAMSIRIGIPVSFVTDKDSNYKGKFVIIDGKETAIINLAYATLDTPIHEILGHPIIRSIKKDNQALYRSLLEDLQYGYGRVILDNVTEAYPELSQEAREEEALVTLLGLLAAKKIDERNNKSLVSHLKELLNTISEAIRKLFNLKTIEIGELQSDLRVSDIANLIAYSNSKFVRPGYAIEYHTPDGKSFKSYETASKHISDLTKTANIDINLDDITLTNDIDARIDRLEKELKVLEDSYQKEYNRLSIAIENAEIEYDTSNLEYIDQQFSITDIAFIRENIMQFLDKEGYRNLVKPYAIELKHTSNKHIGLYADQLPTGYNGAFLSFYATTVVESTGERIENTHVVMPISDKEASALWAKAGSPRRVSIFEKIQELKEELNDLWMNRGRKEAQVNAEKTRSKKHLANVENKVKILRKEIEKEDLRHEIAKTSGANIDYDAWYLSRRPDLLRELNKLEHILENRAILEENLKQAKKDNIEFKAEKELLENELSALNKIILDIRAKGPVDTLSPDMDVIIDATERIRVVLNKLELIRGDINSSTVNILRNSLYLSGVDDDVIEFIMEDKKYSSSLEAIERWKKEEGIVYDPEEVYSRGNGFYSSVCAYSSMEVDVLLKNVLQHIEDNEKSGGSFTISAFTRPTDTKLKHLEKGENIRFVIYPKSEDILWAANTDVYSGSVWSAPSQFNIKSKPELAGVSYTKAPNADLLDGVQPNLADIIDMLNHHHNELGITLTRNNFRFEYDDEVSPELKEVVNNINKILDDKYGKLVKPDIDSIKKNVKKPNKESLTAVEVYGRQVDTINKRLTEIYKEVSDSLTVDAITKKALINKKVAALKQITKKYPRALISSKIVKISEDKAEDTTLYSKVDKAIDGVDNNTSDDSLRTRLMNGKNTATVSEVLTNMKATNKNSSVFVDLIMKAMSDDIANIPITFSERIDFTRNSAAIYDGDERTITIYNDVEFRGKNGTADATILHEVIHAFTTVTLALNPTKRAEAEVLFNHIKKGLSKNLGYTPEQLMEMDPDLFYGLTNVNEFFSELFSNPKFARQIAKLGPTGLVNVDHSNNILLKLIDWLLSIFNITKGNNSYIESMNMLYDIMINHNNTPEGLAESHIGNIFASAQKRTNDSTEIKKILKEKSKNILFDPAPHTYTNVNTGEIYDSVTETKDKAGYGADTNTMTDEDLEYGSMAASIGTTIHNFINSALTGAKEEANTDGFVLTKGAKKFIREEVLPKVLGDNYEILGSETLIANDDALVAGTVDILIKDKNTGKVRLLDMKTKARNFKGNVKYGFDYYFSSKHETKTGGKSDRSRHDYQLTLYKRMLEEYGVQVDEKAIIPLEYNVNEKGEIYEVWLPTLDYARKDGTILLRQDAILENEINSTVLKQMTYDDSVDTAMLNKQSALVKNILTVLRDQYLILLNKGQTTKAETSAEFINRLNTLEETEIIVGYVEKALSLLNPLIQNYNSLLELEKVKGIGVWDLKTLASWKSYAESFENLVAIQNFIFENKGALSDKLVNKLTAALNTAIGYKNNLEQAYKSKGTAIWVKWLAPYVTVVEAEFRREGEREFKRKNKGTATIRDKAAMNKYIDEYLAKNKRIIENRTKQLLLEQSDSIKSGDINMVSRMLDTIFESSDTIVGAMAKAYHTTYADSLEVYNDTYKELVDLTRELENEYYKGDLKNMYSFMYDVYNDAPYIVSRIPISFTKAYDDYTAQVNSSPDYETSSEKSMAIAEWLNKNAPIENKKKLEEDKLAFLKSQFDDKIISEEEYKALIANEKASNVTKRSWAKMVQKNLITESTADLVREKFNKMNWEARVPDKSKYANPKWDMLQSLRNNNPKDIRVRYYDFIKSLSEVGDQAVPKRFKLNGRLPGMTKELSERVRYDSNLPQSLYNNIKKEFTIVADDTDKGAKLLTDELNRPVNFVPIFFTNQISIDEQSFDIGTLYKEWFRSVNNYRYVNSILPQLEFTKYVVETRKSTAVDNNGNPIKNLLSRTTKRNASEENSTDTVMTSTPNLANQLNSWFDQVIYQRSNKSLGTIGKLDIAKSINVLQKYTSLRIMGLNYISMVNNALMAEMQQAKEAFAHKLISPAAYSRASSEYSQDLPNILGDVGSRKIESIVNLLDEHFGIFTDFNTGNISDNNKFKKLFRTSTLYFTTQLGEHEAQSRFLIAALIEKRALDDKGKDIGSMYDYFEAVDGRLVFDKDNKVANFGKTEQIAFGQKVSAVIRKMHGNYQAYSKVALQQNGFGSLTLMFRKWIFNTWKYRWSSEYYDEFGQEYSKGYYRDGGMFYYNKVKGFFTRFVNEAKALELAEKSDWDVMLDDEKANVRRFTTEIAMYMMLSILSSVVGSAMDDEDDEETKRILANIDYQIFRLQTDITFYINPMSTFRIIQSPLPSTSVVTSTAKLIDAFLTPMKKYERGPNKGRYVIEKRTMDLIPLVRQIYRYRDISDEKTMLSIR